MTTTQNQTEINAVGKTALLVAAMRALETKRPESQGRLFTDPYAEILAGPEGMALMQKGLEVSGDQPAIAVRTRYMDDKINEAIHNGIRQIVILAAGMDSRAYRLSLPNETRIFELDRAEVLAYKQDKLKNIKPHCERITISVDLRDEWSDQLVQSGFKTKVPTLWMTEGLLMYLEEDHVLSLFKKITSLASAQDILIFDVLGRSLLESPHMKKQLEYIASIGAPWIYGCNEPELLMQKLGWDAEAIQPGEFAPQRWPFPVAPRHVPNIPRSFFVKATKS